MYEKYKIPWHLSYSNFHLSFKNTEYISNKIRRSIGVTYKFYHCNSNSIYPTILFSHLNPI